MLGEFTVTLARGEKEIAKPVYVVKGQGDTALLSWGATERLVLVEHDLDLTTSTPLPVMWESRQVTVDLVQEDKDEFSGLGKLRGVRVKLHVDPDAKGTVQKQRRISLLFKDKFDEILDKWEQMVIIEEFGDETNRRVQQCCSHSDERRGKHQGKLGHDRCQQVHKENLTCHPHLKRAGNKT